jgi:chromate reductase, NAD(P)H dehydrogenase (quinone)
MAIAPKILVFAGSTRVDSYNKRLARVAAEALRASGAEVTLLDLRELAMPLYDGDLEKSEGLPANAKEFKRRMIAHEGFLISSPEYNSSISGVLKNAIDWASRPEPGEPSLVAFSGKVAALVAASPGNLGGLRGLVTVRSILSNIGVLVLPDQLAVPQAHAAFDDDGKLKDPKQQTTVERIARRLATTVVKLRAETPEG